MRVVYHIAFAFLILGVTMSGSTAQQEVPRAEIGTSLPLIRLVLFGDVGWAAAPRELFESDPLVGVGPGVSFF